ncbi:uncharacterized protein [Amphiura filiformis]|uniref:uncharacterized protein n=1 Tax=Amphiura filiformis TaxID=82378 RepID=UPI003B217EC1
MECKMFIELRPTMVFILFIDNLGCNEVEQRLLERLRDKEAVLCAEGYVMSFERRGYLQAGPFIPEVVLGRPDLVRLQYEEFVHAGSDVVVAFTHYTQRARLKHVGKEDQLEAINRYALRLAKGVALQTGTLMAGTICNTSLFIPNSFDSKEAVKAIFREQVGWAVQEGADYVIGETFGHVGEAILATEVIKEAGLPAVVTLRVTNQFFVEGKLATFDGIELGQALQMLQNAGADVVGFNCSTGPRTMVSLLAQYRQYVQVPFAALPVGYRTNENEVTYQDLTDPLTGRKVFPDNLDCVMCSRDEIVEFGRQCAQLGVQYLGLCCGNNAGFTRALSESIGRISPASRFRPDMSKYVSDLQRRLMFLQKLKEMEGESEDQEQQVSSDEEEHKNADSGKGFDEPDETAEQVKEEQPSTLNGVSPQQNGKEQETSVQKSTEKLEKDESEQVANGGGPVLSSEMSPKKPSGTPADEFAIRLPPPPGGLKRSDSKRSRSSQSPATSENNEAEIRLPPPPSSGATRKDSRSRRRKSSSSSSSSSDSAPGSNEADFHLPPPPGFGVSNTNSREAVSAVSEDGNTKNNQAAVNGNLHQPISEPAPDADKSSTNNNTTSQSSPLPLIQIQANTESAPIVQEQLEQQSLREQKADQSVEETLSQSTPVESPGADLQESPPQNDGQPSLHLVQDNVDNEGEHASASSGDEVAYTRLEKEDDDEEQFQQEWASFATNTTNGNNGSVETQPEPQINIEDNGSNWANFESSKPSEASENQWAEIAATKDKTDDTKTNENGADGNGSSKSGAPTTEL